MDINQVLADVGFTLGHLKARTTSLSLADAKRLLLIHTEMESPAYFEIFSTYLSFFGGESFADGVVLGVDPEEHPEQDTTCEGAGTEISGSGLLDELFAKAAAAYMPDMALYIQGEECPVVPGDLYWLVNAPSLRGLSGTIQCRACILQMVPITGKTGATHRITQFREELPVERLRGAYTFTPTPTIEPAEIEDETHEPRRQAGLQGK